MAKNTIPRGATSVIRHIFIQDSSSTTGAGKTGLAHNTASLTAYYLYPGGTATALTLEDISTLGTYAAPTSNAHMRFKKVDDTNMPGFYEVQFHNDWFSVANGRVGGIVQMKGATDMAPVQWEFDVIGFEIQDADPPVDVTKISGDSTAADNCELMFDGTGYAGGTTKLGVDAVAISGDTGAADALESQFDGTGLTGDTYPARQDQVNNLAIASSSINTVAESYTLTTGTQSSGTYASTQALDGTTHQHTDTAGAMELYYQFDVGDSGIPASVKVTGALTGLNDSLGVFAYNWGGTAWNQIGTLAGAGTATNTVNVYDLLTSHVGTGSNAGKVQIRFYAASGLTSATLYVDQILVSYAQGVTGIPNGTTITLSSSAANRSLIGHNWNLDLNGQSIAGAYIYQSTNITGTATGTNGTPFTIQQCAIGTASLPAFGYIDYSALTDTLTLTSTGGGTADSITLIDCLSGIPGSGAPTIDASGVSKATGLAIRDWHGGLTLVLNSSCTTTVEGTAGNGTVTVTTGGGNTEIRGVWKAVALTTSGAGTTNIVVFSGCPISIAGTGGTVNIYGVHGAITDTSSGTTVNDLGMTVSHVGAIKTKTDFLPSATAGQNGGLPTVDANNYIAGIQDTGSGINQLEDLNNLSTAQVNAEMVDVLATDVAAELANIPAANASLKDKITLLAMIARNQITQTATTLTVFKDGGTSLGTATVSDDATTYTRGKLS